jgi:hypothetical protein
MQEMAEDLYDDVSVQQLPSALELRQSLVAAQTERAGLQAELDALQRTFQSTKPALEDLVKRACVLLCTARQEIRRKEEQLQQLQQEAQRRNHQHHQPWQSQPAPAAPPASWVENSPTDDRGCPQHRTDRAATDPECDVDDLDL